MDVTPVRFFKAPSTLVPFAARSANVFFTTAYFAPEVRTVLRSSKSCATVSLLNVVTIRLEIFFSSAPNFSVSSIFFALLTAIIKASSAHCALSGA